MLSFLRFPPKLTKTQQIIKHSRFVQIVQQQIRPILAVFTTKTRVPNNVQKTIQQFSKNCGSVCPSLQLESSTVDGSEKKLIGPFKRIYIPRFKWITIQIHKFIKTFLLRSVAQTYLGPELGHGFLFFDVLGSNVGLPDLSSWENIQLFMENSNPTSKILDFRT